MRRYPFGALLLCAMPVTGAKPAAIADKAVFRKVLRFISRLIANLHMLRSNADHAAPIKSQTNTDIKNEQRRVVN